MFNRWFRVMATVFLIGAVGCSSDSSSSGDGSKSTAGGASESAEAGSISVTAKDFGIAESTAQAPSGEVTFAIHNAGPSVHEFVVIKTDLSDGDLPLVKDGSEVNEDKLEGIGEQEDIQPNTDATLSLNLDPGHYVFICNIPGHYTKGMHSSFTVQ